MGIASEKDVARFATDHHVYEGDDLCEDLFALIDPESAAQDVEGFDLKNCTKYGWTLDWDWKSGNWQCGKSGEIDAPCWKKGNFSVWLVNESPNESVGHCSLTVVGKDELSILVFLKDFETLLRAPATVKVIKNKPIIHYY